MKLLISAAVLLCLVSATPEPENESSGVGHCRGKHCAKTIVRLKRSSDDDFPPPPPLFDFPPPDFDNSPPGSDVPPPTPVPEPADPIWCGGHVPYNTLTFCPQGQICQYPPTSLCYGDFAKGCRGQCVGQRCGGYHLGNALPPCPNGQVCTRRPDQPREDQVTDLAGTCVFNDTTCLSSGYNDCPTDWNCVDVSNDACDPWKGHQNCKAVCSYNQSVTHGNAGGDPHPA